jgi:vitamin B12 transporter
MISFNPTHRTNPFETLLFSFLVLIASGARADNHETEVSDTIIVTGTRLNQTIENMPSHVTVIDRNEIEQRRDASMLDLLRSVSGVHVTQLGGRGGLASVYLRGSEPNFTVVLIDGMKVNDPNNTRGGSFDFSTLNLSQVERVEIVRGAQSSVYGSDGLSGIISITTRDSQEPGANLALELGEDDLTKGSINLFSTIGETTRINLNLAAEDDGDPVEGNKFETRSIGFSLAGDLNNKVSYILKTRYADSESEAFPEDSGGPELAVVRDVDQRDQTQNTYTASLAYELSDSAHINAFAGYAKHEEKTSSPGIAPGIRNGVPASLADSELTRFNATINGVFNLSDQMVATVGIDHQDEDGELVGTLELFPGFTLPQDFDLDRQIRGIFGEISYQPSSAVTLNLSVRNDDPDGYSSETTTRVGGQFVTGNTRYFASWGEGFKLPSFFSLGHALVGNPDLKPETSTNWELGFSHQINDELTLTLTGFNNEFENLIDFDSTIFRMVNLNEVENKGMELATRYQATEDLVLSAHMTYVDIDVKGPGELLQRPDWRGGLGIQWQATSSLSLNIDWLYVDEVLDSSVPTGPLVLDSYNRLDIVGSWRPSESLSVYLALDNALDKNYEAAIGFPAVGMRARLGLNYSL